MKEKDEQVCTALRLARSSLISGHERPTSQIARLTEENQRLAETAAKEAKKVRQRCDELTAELEKRTHRMQQLEALLADQSDYEAIKKELR